jgi:hypothetical protein
MQQAPDIALAPANDVGEQSEQIDPDFHARFTIRKPPISSPSASENAQSVVRSMTKSLTNPITDATKAV